MTPNNLILSSPARYGVEPALSAVAAEFDARKAFDDDALSNLAYECFESLKTALDIGDESLVGKVLLSAYRAEIEQRIDFRLFGRTSRPDAADAAARLVLLAASVKETA